MEVYTQIPSLNKAVGTAVNQMITPYIPSQPVAKVSPFPAFSEPKVEVKRHSISLESNGYVGGLQMTLTHGSNFNINLADAYISEYRTIGNKTTVVMVSDGASITDIASINGSVKVESMMQPKIA